MEDLELLLDSTQIFFDVTAITETRIVKNKFPLNVNKGGTLLYIGSYLSYKPRNDLCIYKTVGLESGIRVWT